jgi:hypothetical protein
MIKTMFLLIILVNFSINANVQMDNPQKGEYLFPLEKVWELETAGESLFARPGNIRVANDGRIFCYDRQNLKYYIFDSSGKLLRAFGKKGEGPGEIRRIEQAPLFLINKTIIIHDTGRLHFFTWDGDFIKSVVNLNQYRPNFFLNENEFITAPRTRLDIPEGKAKIRWVNLNTKKEKVVTTFDIFKGGVISSENIQAGMVSPTLSPLMIIGHYNNKLYYGMSDQYRIHISDMDGKARGIFGLKRKKNPVSEKVKIERILRLAKGRAPEELLRTLAKKLPNEESHFNRIEGHNGLIYLFNSHFDRKNIQKLDIFSEDREYLYRGLIQVDPEYIILTDPFIFKNTMIMALENEDGEIVLVIYNTNLPTG